MKRFLCVLVAAMALCGCASNKSEYGVSYDSKASNSGGAAPSAPQTAEMAAMDASAYGVDGGVGFTEAERKIIQTAEYNINTADYASAEQNVRGLAVGFGGYVQQSGFSQSASGKQTLSQGHFTLRVPAEAYDRTLAALELIGEVTRKSAGSDDVTAQYTDVESRLRVKEAEEGRLLAMLAKTEDVYGLIQLEQRLADVRTDIELYQSRLKNIDRLADYATITVTLREVTAAEMGGGLGARLAGAFVSGARFIAACGEALALFVAAAIVPALALAAIAGLALLILRVFKRKRP